MPRLFDPPTTALRVCLLIACALTFCAAGQGSELRRSAFVAAVQRARPAVVNIHGNKTVPLADATQVRDETGEMQRVNGMGTGVVIDPRGYIVTNYHVVEGVQQIRVNLSDGVSLPASVVAHDAQTDLALIKVPVTEPLPTITLGTSRDLMLGEDVVAIGNAFGYEHTVTRGIISFLHRNVQVSDSQYFHDSIQTDASINPGNSGGPLLNIDGEMIGIIAAVRMGAQGIGFAIPVDKMLEVTSRMIRAHVDDGVDHGLVLEPSPTGAGVRARRIQSRSAAEQAGLQPGDMVLSVDGREVRHRVDLDLALLERHPGDSIPLVVRRGDETIDVQLVLGRRAAVERNRLEDDIWNLLGLRLEKIDAEEFRQFNSQFAGGLRITEVRRLGPAWEYHIREGDVLVGLLELETLNLNHVAYILNKARQSKTEPVTFYVLRSGDPYSGKLQVAWTNDTAVR